MFLYPFWFIRDDTDIAVFDRVCLRYEDNVKKEVEMRAQPVLDLLCLCPTLLSLPPWRCCSLLMICRELMSLF